MSEFAVTSRFADRQRDERLTGNVLPPSGTAAGLVLTSNADGTSSWQAPAGSGGLALLYSNILGADAAAIDTGTNGIPGTSTHMVVMMSLRSTRVANFDSGALQLNGDTAANYYTEVVTGTGATASASEILPATSLYFEMPAASAPANLFGSQDGRWLNYVGTSHLKVGSSNGGYSKGLSSGNVVIQMLSWTWNNTSAINRLKVAANNGNLLAGSAVWIYGI